MVPYWYWLLPIAVFWILSVIRRSAWFRGKLGEFKVNVGISRHLDRNVYRLIKNVTLSVGGGTTQIDHLVVSPYGIFVIETKNITGWIFGRPSQPEWTQVFYRFKKRFQNPLVQNNRHVELIRDLLGLDHDQVHNVVVFVGACTFKTPMPPEIVHGVFGLIGFIGAKSVSVFTEYEVRSFIEDILTQRLKPGFRTDRIHVKNVKRTISEKRK